MGVLVVMGIVAVLAIGWAVRLYLQERRPGD